MSKRNYRAIKIDPFDEKVTEVFLTDLDSKNPYAGMSPQIYNLVGTENTGHLRIDKNHSDWHDDLSAFVPWDRQAFFKAPWYPTPLAGVHLITGMKWITVEDEDGYRYEEDTLDDVKFDLDKLRDAIQWLDARSVVIPSTRLTTFDKDGKPHTDIIGGDENGNWTYTNQPK